jgi:two-component system response regulator DegU
MDQQDSDEGKKYTILILDDNQIFLQAVIGLLKRITHVEVIGTASENTALEIAEEFRPEVVLVDMDMPICIGIRSIKLLRKILPESKIFAMSMLNESGFRKLALSVGADDFIYKPNLDDNAMANTLPKVIP